ncbi:hypothetical protein Adt_39984 [Abeliophyllum distichum]|uniref:Uncharacterized protein n=1 Tax=Abeliophyllum distichum TaxID=126358 RepID=A0ABD1Q8B8_9LAMI
MILGFSQLVPCLNEDARPLCGMTILQNLSPNYGRSFSELGRGLFSEALPISDEARYWTFSNWCHALMKRLGPYVGMTLLQKLSPNYGKSFFVLRRDLFVEALPISY